MSRRKRLESLRHDDYVPFPDMSAWRDAIMATCVAHEAGRPYSRCDNPLRQPVKPWEGQEAFIQQHLEMAKRGPRNP